MCLWEKRSAFQPKQLGNLPSKTAEREATRISLNEGMEFSWVRILVVLGCYSGWIGLNRDTSQGSLGPGAEDVREIAPCAVLSENS